jgi:hypothetical protein
MASFVIQPKRQAAAAPLIFTGPARWAAAFVLVAGPLLQAIEFLLVANPDDNAARVASWVEQPTQVGLSMASGVLAVPFLIGGVAVLVGLTRPYSPRLALAAGALMTLAMAGLAAVHGYELAAFGLAQSGDLAAATAALNAENLGAPGIAMLIMFLGGAALGTLTLAAAMWRSPLVPRVAVGCVLAFAALDFILGRGVEGHLANLAGFAIVAVAVVIKYSRPAR